MPWCEWCNRVQGGQHLWQQQQHMACASSRLTATLLLFVLAIVLPNDQLATSIRDLVSCSKQHPTRAALAEASLGSWHQCSSQAIYSGMYGAELIANLTEWRSNLLSHVWSSFDPSVPYLEGFKRFDPMRPFISCPPRQPLIRYGSEADGGKLLCDISKLRPPCLIYSLGSNGDYSFERDALNITQCDIHTFDCTYDGSSVDPKRHTYHKVCVGQGGPLFKSWDEITRGLGHHHRGVDVAKIDIEGHEPAVLSEFRHDTALPRQIVIEIHMRPPGHTGIAPPAPRTPAQVGLLFMHMGSLGYGVVGEEDNIWGEKGCCAEFTFLHVERQWLGFLGRAVRTHRGGSQHRGHNAFQQAKAALTTGDDNAAASGYQRDGQKRRLYHQGRPSLQQQP